MTCEECGMYFDCWLLVMLGEGRNENLWEFSGPTSDVQTIPTQDIMTSSVGCHPLVSP